MWWRLERNETMLIDASWRPALFTSSLFHILHQDLCCLLDYTVHSFVFDFCPIEELFEPGLAEFRATRASNVTPLPVWATQPTSMVWLMGRMACRNNIINVAAISAFSLKYGPVQTIHHHDLFLILVFYSGLPRTFTLLVSSGSNRCGL